MLTLRELTENDEAAFFKGMSHWAENERDWHTFSWKPGMPFTELLEILRKERLGIDLAPGRVPHSMLYAFVGDEIIGRLSVRHALNEFLSRRGGHIGWAVAPPFRRKGYASEIARLGLDYFRSLGLDKLLITCLDTNEPSWRIIEKLGGGLESKFTDEKDGALVRRYWLTL